MDLSTWLLTEARYATNAGEMLARLCERLNERGFSIMRSTMQLLTLHSEVSLELFVWRRDERRIEIPQENRLASAPIIPVQARTERILLKHGAFQSATYFASPFYTVGQTKKTLHCPIMKGQQEFAYPILRDLHDLGGTGYLAVPMQFTEGPISVQGWATDKPGGFTAADIAEIEALLPAFTAACEVFSLRHTVESLVRIYLGAGPGQQVLAGQVKPGDVNSIEAAIWFSDLRGFTQLSGQLETRALVATLNEYFNALSVPIAENGGEILKFIGDAVLVIFPVNAERNAKAACQSAVAAAIAAGKSLDSLNAERGTKRLPPLEHGIGLHFGNAEYGNIGASDRLDFTVIGNDVNFASRVEGLCSKLRQRVLASKELAQHIPEKAWENMGSHELKGITGTREIFSLPQNSD